MCRVTPCGEPRLCRPAVPVASPIGASHLAGVKVVTATGAPAAPGAMSLHSGGRGGGGGGGGGELVSKSAQAVVSPAAVIAHAPGPLHAPPQPAKLEPLRAAAASDTLVPACTVMLQLPGQSMPAGLDMTRPEPLPVNATLMRASFFAGGPGLVSNTAVTSRPASML